MNCPHCQFHLTQSTAKADVLFELCSRCGTLCLDFGQTRPKLYQAVEAQVTRWEKAHHASHPIQSRQPARAL